MNPSDHIFSKAQRQSPAAILIVIVKLLRNLIRQMWPFLLVILFGTGKSSRAGYFAAFGAFVSGMSVIRSIVSYFTFYFYIKDDELIIDKGLIKKEHLNIPFDRIQTIDFEQNIFHRMFDVVSVRIDTAGSASQEFSITALELEKAEALRSYVMDKIGGAEKSDEPLVTQSRVETVIHKLDIPDLIKIGISQNHLQTAGFIFAFVFSFLDDIQEIFGDTLFDYFGVKDEKGLYALMFSSISLFAFFILVSFLLTLLRTVFKYYNFRLLDKDQGFKSISGLFTKRESSVKLRKIQIIKWRNNPIYKLFGMWKGNIQQASSRAVSLKKAMAIPGMDAQALQAIQSAFIPEWDTLTFEHNAISKHIIWRTVLYYGLIPALAIALFSYYRWEVLAWQLVFWPILMTILTFIYHKKRKWLLHSDYLISQSGIIGTQRALIKLFKVQSVSLNQNLFQQRRDLATVTIHTASGNLSIPYIALSKAQALRDYVIYKVESDRRDWM